MVKGLERHAIRAVSQACSKWFLRALFWVPSLETFFKISRNGFIFGGRIVYQMYAISNDTSYERMIQYNFQGFSMYPLVKPGDRLIVKRGAYGPAKLGDIVLFENNQSSPDRGLTAHRIVRIISRNRFVTKGDNLLRHDPGVRSSHDIVGQAVMLVRKNRLVPLTKGLYGCVGRLMACYSRKNMTPGIIMSRVKHLAGLT